MQGSPGYYLNGGTLVLSAAFLGSVRTSGSVIIDNETLPFSIFVGFFLKTRYNLLFNYSLQTTVV